MTGSRLTNGVKWSFTQGNGALTRAIDVVGLLGIPIILFYAREHALLEEPLRHGSLLPGVLARGVLAFVCSLVGILLLETIGAGLLSVRQIKPIRGMPLAAGISWVVLGAMTLLVLGTFGPVSAALLLLPLVPAIRKRTGIVDGSIMRGLGFWAWAIIALFGTIAGAVSLAPSITYDDHIYHLQAIQGFLESGSLWISSDQPNIYRPMGHAVFMTWLQTIFGSTIGGIANLLFLVALSFLVARRASMGILGILVWVSMPQLIFFAGSSYSEPFLCLVFILALHLFSRDGDRDFKPTDHAFLVQEGATAKNEDVDSTFFILLFGGLGAGLLPGIKYTGVLLIPVLLVSWHSRFSVNSSFRRSLPPVILGFLISFALVAFPFLLRNAVYTGNMVHPHLSSVSSQFLNLTGLSFATNTLREKWKVTPARFGLPFEDLKSEKEDLAKYSYEEFTNCFGMGHDPLSILVSPWNVTQYGHFHDAKYPLRFFDGQLSPLFLISLLLISALFIASSHQERSASRSKATDPGSPAPSEGAGTPPLERLPSPELTPPGPLQPDDEAKPSWEHPQIVEIVACSLFMMAAWVFGSHQIRFLMPLVAYAAWVTPVLLEGIDRKRIVAWVLLTVVSSVWAMGYGMTKVDGAAPYLAGLITREDYFARKLPFYPGFAWANKHLPPSGKILVLFEETTHLLTCRHVWTECIPAAYINFLFKSGSVETVEAVFKRNGITHLFMPRYGWAIFADVDDPVFQTVHRDLFEKRLKVVYSDEGYEIYSWKNP